MDRTALSVTSLTDESGDREFWLSKTPKPGDDWRRWSCCERSTLATIHFPPDFKEFFQLLNSERIEYLLVGGYAVG